jgi:hypothetical protein
MNTKKVGIALAAAALAVGLTACGSSSDKELSKTDLVAKANAICKTATATGNKIKAPASLDNPTTAAAYFDKVAPLVEKEDHDLRALKPDSDVKADWNAYLTAEGKAVALLAKVTRKAHAKDPSGVTDLQNATTGPPVQAAARKLGMTECEK